MTQARKPNLDFKRFIAQARRQYELLRTQEQIAADNWIASHMPEELLFWDALQSR